MSALAVRVDLGCALLALVAWTSPDVIDGALALPERSPLHAAAWVCLERYRGAFSPSQERALVDRYRRWRAAYESTSLDLAHVWSPYAVLSADLLATLDEVLCDARAGQAARRAKGKPVSREGAARLAEIETLERALATYDSALHRAIGYERASREATFQADKLHQQIAGAP